MVAMFVEPVPNRSPPALATATMRKLVSESFSGIVASASPLASSVTRPCHVSSVSNSSRARSRPPPPPCGTALRPNVRLPITSICAVAVHTSSPRRPIIASSRFQLGFGARSSSASSTAATATSAPARQRLAVGARDVDLHVRLLAHREARAIGGDAHVEAMRLPADADLGRAEPIARLAQIDQRRRSAAVARNEVGQIEAARHVGEPARKRADAAAHRQHRNEHVRRIGVADRHFDDRIAAARAS